MCIVYEVEHNYFEGVTNPNFKGFIVDNSQAKWNVVHIVYGTRDFIVNMIDKESTWLFH